MATKIRLTRLGDKKAPFYRVVVADERCARDGKYIENLGTYNPLKQPFELNLKDERVKYWLENGAQPTETARELLVKANILEAKKYVAPKPKQMPPAPKAKEEAPAEDSEASTSNEQPAEVA